MTGIETELSLVTYAIVAIAAFAGALLASMSGSGSSLLLAPVLLPLIGIKALLPVIAVGSLFGNIARAWVYKEWIEWKLFTKVGLPAAPGVIVGVLIYDWLPQATLLAIFGLFMIVSLPIRRWTDSLKLKPSPTGVASGSFSFGIIAGSVPLGGIVLVAMLLGFGLRGGAILGTDAMISVLTNFCRVGGFTSVGLLNLQLIILGIIIGVMTIPAAYIGRYLVVRMGVKIHTVLLDGVVILTGCYFVFEAARSVVLRKPLSTKGYSAL